MTISKNYDVIIIGGSYAGLSAAMTLGRSRRKVLIIDSGKPCNKQTPYSHNFITQDGEKPRDIAQKAKKQVLEYPSIQFLEDFALSGNKTNQGFEIQTDSGKTFFASKLLFATGVKDTMPDIEGFAACWGITAIHCPYCHGYEFKNQKTGIMANGEQAYHLASLVNNLTDDITILTQGKANFTEEQLEKLNTHNIKINENPILKIEHQDGKLENIIFANGNKEHYTATYAALPFKQHSNIPMSLGCQLTDAGHIHVDVFQKTSVSGIYACGDNSSKLRSLAYAIATGNIAGVMINHELTQENF